MLCHLYPVFLKLHSAGNYNIAITKGVFDYFNLRPNTYITIYDGVFDIKTAPAFRNSEPNNSWQFKRNME